MTQSQNSQKTTLLDKLWFLILFFSTNRIGLQKGTSKIKLYPTIACHAESLNYMQKTSIRTSIIITVQKKLWERNEVKYHWKKIYWGKKKKVFFPTSD